MKKVPASLAALLLVAGSLCANAQVAETWNFTNLNQSIPDGNASGLHDVRTVTSTILSLASVRLRLRVAGEFNGDLYGYVRHIQGGTTNFCVLLNRPGRTSANPAGYADAGLNVLFDDAAVAGDIHRYQAVTNPPAGTPLTGAWQPDGRWVDPDVVLDTSPRTTTLSSFNSIEASGEWTLYLADLAAGGTNMLVSWELDLTGIATPTVTWPTPADIVYGAALGSAQLIASSLVPGTFAYNPPAGTFLNAGSNQTLSVSFTPNDSSSYVSVTNTVSINVLKAPLGITANNTNKVYGQTVTFAGTEFASSGLVNSDTVSGVTLTSAGTGATATVAGSPYTIVPSAATGTGLANYTIGYTNGTLTVGSRPLGVTANNTNKVYGQTVTLPGTAFTSSGLVNGDTVTSVTLTSAGAAAAATVAGSPYSIVPSAATGTGLANYTIGYTNGALTVGARLLGVTANNTNKVYGQTVTFGGTEFSSSGLVNSDSVSSVTLTSTGSGATATVAGSPYNIVPSAATGTGLANYAIGYTNGTLTVSNKSLTITANNTNKVYGQTVTLPATAFTSSGLVNSDTVTSVTLTSAGTGATATVAGSPYSIVPSVATGSGLANYTIGYTNGTLTVGARPLGITASNTNKVYGQTVTFAGTEFSSSGLVNSDTVTSVTLTSAGAVATAGVASSPYSIVPSAATGTGLANYTIGYTNGTLSVGARPLGITANNTNKVYGQTVTFAGTEFMPSGLVNSDTVTGVTLTSAGSGAAATVAGSPYSIVPSAATGTGLANYTIGYTNGTLTVGARTLGITANNTNKVYGQTVTFAGTQFSSAGLVNSDTVTGVTLTSAGATATATVAGSPYSIVPSAAAGTGLANYTIGYTNGTLAVGAKPLGITANNTNKVYGQTVTLPGTAFTSSGLVNGDTVTSVTLTSAGAAAAATVAGSPYSIVPSAATGTGLANYTIGYTNGTLAVGAKPLGITANNTNKVYGQTVTFAGTEFSSSGLVNSDSVSSVTLTSTGSGATATVAGSPYNIVPSLATGTGLANYAIGYTNGTLTVSNKALTITANNTNKVYGQMVTFAGTEFTSAGLVNSDTVSTVTLASAGSGATATVAGSPYSIVPSAAAGTGLANYAINYTNGTLTVSNKPLTITANNTNKVYGQTVTFAGTEFTSAGLVNSDAVGSVTLTSAAAGATATVAGSPYSIVPSAATGTGLANYSINYANGTLTVSNKSLTITANNTNKVYGQTVTFAGTEFSSAGLVNSDTVSSVILTSAGSAATATVAGSPYSIVPSAATGTGLGNYTIGYANGTITITKAGSIGILSSSSNPSPPGQAVVFSLTLNAVAPGVGTPTSTVQFKIDGANAGAPVSLNAGTASSSPFNLAHGTHTVAAQYAGDGNFNGTTNLLSPVQLINTPPVPGAVTIERDPTNATKVSVATLLTSGSDADGDPIAFLGASTNSANGGTVVSNSGWIFYTPASGFTNADSFTYTISDNWGASATGAVTVNVRLDNGPAPNLIIISLGAGSNAIVGNGIPNRTYRIQFGETASPTNWQNLGTSTSNPSGTFWFIDPNGAPQRFYRSVYP